MTVSISNRYLLLLERIISNLLHHVIRVAKLIVLIWHLIIILLDQLAVIGVIMPLSIACRLLITYPDLILDLIAR